MSDIHAFQPTQRFSNRVANYVKYRPSYPPELLGFLRREIDFRADWLVADVGSGTSILSKLLIDQGAAVYAIEPNAEMADAAAEWLGDHPAFHRVDGRAEATGLAEHVIDLVIAGQAFHWFDVEPTRREFLRILKPDGWCVLVWNHRSVEATPFLREYESLLNRWATDYREVSRTYEDESAMATLFGEHGYRTASFENFQLFDYEGLQGRLLSSSYAPPAEDTRQQPMLTALRELFESYQSNGRVRFEYDTNVYWGRLT